MPDFYRPKQREVLYSKHPIFSSLASCRLPQLLAIVTVSPNNATINMPDFCPEPQAGEGRVGTSNARKRRVSSGTPQVTTNDLIFGDKAKVSFGARCYHLTMNLISNPASPKYLIIFGLPVLVISLPLLLEIYLRPRMVNIVSIGPTV